MTFRRPKSNKNNQECLSLDYGLSHGLRSSNLDYYLVLFYLSTDFSIDIIRNATYNKNKFSCFRANTINNLR